MTSSLIFAKVLFSLELPSISTRLKRPLFQVYHLFSTEIFPLSPAIQRKSLLFSDLTRTEMIKEWLGKLWYNVYVVSSPWQKVFRQLISLLKKQCNVCSQNGWLTSPCWFRSSSRFSFWILELGFSLLWSHYLFIGPNNYFIFSFIMRMDLPSKKKRANMCC